MEIKSSDFLAFLCLLGLLLPFLPSSNGFCRFQEFRCKGGSICLLSEKLCDGIEDCPGGEDEKGTEQWDCSRVTLGTSTECGDQRKFFKCRFGGCIVKSQVCDGISNCWGGTDEAVDLCGNRQKVVDEPGTTEKEKTRPTSPRPRTTTTTTSAPRPVTRRTTMTPKALPPRPVEPRPPPIPSSPTPVTLLQNEGVASAGSSKEDDSSCPPLKVGEGEEVKCLNAEVAQIIDCTQKSSPEGTKAIIKCAQFWTPPITGSRSRERVCKDGSWRGGSRSFQCQLDCGQGGHPPVALVAGGIISQQGKWPWHAGIYEADPPGSNSFSNICGGTLIAPNAVLTAGHCITIPHTNDVKNRRDLLLFLGKFYRSAGRNDENVQAVKPHKIVLHPDYNYANLDSDIAIIFLQKSVQITSFVHPVCLPSEEEELFVGAKGTLAGWGSTGDRTYPEELQEAELPYVSSLTCRKSHSALKALIRQTNFCAGHKNGTSACDGDSGSGLVFTHPDDTSKWVVGGVVSGGVPRTGGRGCDPHHYVAFTNVAKFRHWVDRVLDKGVEDLFK